MDTILACKSDVCMLMGGHMCTIAPVLCALPSLWGRLPLAQDDRFVCDYSISWSMDK